MKIRITFKDGSLEEVTLERGQNVVDALCNYCVNIGQTFDWVAKYEPVI